MLVYQVVAIGMIDMGVGHEQTHRPQLFTINVLDQPPALSRLEHATIYDDGFARIVRHHMGTLLIIIDNKFLDVNHGSKNKKYRGYKKPGANQFLYRTGQHAPVIQLISIESLTAWTWRGACPNEHS